MARAFKTTISSCELADSNSLCRFPVMSAEHADVPQIPEIADEAADNSLILPGVGLAIFIVFAAMTFVRSEPTAPVQQPAADVPAEEAIELR